MTILQNVDGKTPGSRNAADGPFTHDNKLNEIRFTEHAKQAGIVRAIRLVYAKAKAILHGGESVW